MIDEFWEESSKLMILTGFDPKSNTEDDYDIISEIDLTSIIFNRMRFITYYIYSINKNDSNHFEYTTQIDNCSIEYRYYINDYRIGIQIDDCLIHYIYDYKYDYLLIMMCPKSCGECKGYVELNHRNSIIISKVKDCDIGYEDYIHKMYDKSIDYLAHSDILTKIIRSYIGDIING